MTKPDPTTPTPIEPTRTPTIGAVSSIRGNPIETVQPQARPSEKVMAFVKDHPVALVAGGIAVGVLATALLPRGLRKSVAKKALGAAKAAGAAALTFGHDAEDRAEHLGSRASRSARKLLDSTEELSESAREHAEEYGSKAAQRVGKLGTALLASAKSFSKTTANRAHDLAEDAADRGSDAMKRARAVRKAMTD